MADTPNMGMTLPVVSTTLGPEWASELNAALLIVDSHNHAPGSGAPISFSSLSPDIDLSFGSFNATDLRTVRLSDQSSISLVASDIRILYSKSGELYYRDSAGNEVVITNAGSVAGATGSISGLVPPASAVYSAGRFTFSKDTSKPGKLSISDIDIYEFDNASAQAITIKSPSAVVAYSLTLPATTPAATAFVTMSNAGILGTTGLSSYISGTANQIAVTPSSSAVTLSLPQDIGTSSSVVFSQVNATGNGLFTADGSVSVASFGFISEASTGLYRQGAGLLSVTVLGTPVATFHATGLEVLNGSASNPSIMGSSITSGIYFNGATEVGISLSGIQQVRFLSNQVRGPDGSAGTPGISFINDPDTGIYRATGNELDFAVGGVQAGKITSAGLAMFDGISAGATVSSLKWASFSGSLTSGSNTSLIISGTVVGATGFCTTAGARVPINPLNYDSVQLGLQWQSASAGDRVALTNSAISTLGYRVVVYYV